MTGVFWNSRDTISRPVQRAPGPAPLKSGVAVRVRAKRRMAWYLSTATLDRVSSKQPTLESCTWPFTGPLDLVLMNQLATPEISWASTWGIGVRGTQRVIWSPSKSAL